MSEQAAESSMLSHKAMSKSHKESKSTGENLEVEGKTKKQHQN
jgi:hypothetical protein